MRCNFPIITIFVCILSIAVPAVATIKNLGVTGQTYPVVESDIIAELKQKAADMQLSQKQILDRARKYQPTGLQKLPQATADKTRMVDMTYTLDTDLTDGEGKVIYPRGYTFNPLDYIGLPGGLLVIDGDDPRQVKWFKKTPYADNHRVRLLLSGGYAYGLVKELQRPVFYLTGDIARRFQLTAVPALITRKGDKMQVREFYVSPDEQGQSNEQ